MLTPYVALPAIDVQDFRKAALAAVDLNQPQQHSQLRAMGVVEPKTKKPSTKAEGS